MRFFLNFNLLLLTAACASLPTGGRSDIAFEMAQGRPVVLATLQDGSTAKFIFDTGSQGNVISQTTAERLNLRRGGKIKVGSGADGIAVEADLVDLGGLQIAGVPMRDLKGVTGSDEQLMLVPGVAGVLAPSGFTDRIVELDFAHKTLRFPKAPTGQVDTWFDLDERNMLRGEVLISGRLVPFTIDAGNPGGAILSLNLAKAIAPNARFDVVGQVRTVDAVNALSIGRIDTPVILAGKATQLGVVGALDGGPDYINFGSAALQGLTVVLDNPNRRWGLFGTLPAEISMRPPGPPRPAEPL